MTARTRPTDRGAARGRAIVSSLAGDAESARLEHGLSYSDLGRAIGLSGEQVARICRGQSPELSIVRASMLLAAVGLDFGARAFPGGPPIRDAAHIALLARLRARISAKLEWRTEVPVLASTPSRAAGPPDRRAWDAVVTGASWRVGIEAETRLHDVQSLARRIGLKTRDGDVAAVILLINDTAHNRRVLQMDGVDLKAQFPWSGRLILRRLEDGEHPVKSAIVVL